MRVLVTGCAGFIGFHLTQHLLQRGDRVLGLDNLNNYYDVSLKKSRLALLENNDRFHFVKEDIANRAAMDKLFKEHSFDAVLHMAAQAGVRYSLTDPYAYVDSNMTGFGHILEGCRQQNVKHLVFASSSSVYGANEKFPFSESDNVDHPLALYAATKKANELMAHSYAHLFHIPCTGLRFFTVYGPWGRPDMALFKFTRSMLANQPIDVYNHGKMSRDFTFIDDIVNGVILALDHPPTPDATWSGKHPDPATSRAPYRIYNIGSHRPIALMDFVGSLEKILNKKAIINMLPMQPGDVAETYADISRLEKDCGYKPKTSLEEGIKKFVEWYLKYYTART